MVRLSQMLEGEFASATAPGALQIAEDPGSSDLNCRGLLTKEDLDSQSWSLILSLLGPNKYLFLEP